MTSRLQANAALFALLVQDPLATGAATGDGAVALAGATGVLLVAAGFAGAAVLLATPAAAAAGFGAAFAAGFAGFFFGADSFGRMMPWRVASNSSLETSSSSLPFQFEPSGSLFSTCLAEAMYCAVVNAGAGAGSGA